MARPSYWVRWRRGALWTSAGVVLIVVASRGLVFVREAVVAALFGASAKSDAYLLAFALPTLVYSVGAVPFSLWVTARVTLYRTSGESARLAQFARRAQWTVLLAGLAATVVVELFANTLVRFYAPGLDAARLADAVRVTRLGALAIPGLGIQAIANARLFAEGRFLAAYGWAAAGSLAGLIVVLVFAPVYGPAGAILSFVVGGWVSGLGPLLSLRWSRTLPAAVAGTGDAAADFGVGVVSRALVMQLFLQSSLLITYFFGSTLPAGELAGTLFAMKIQTAVYETLVVTAGVLVYPRFARHLQSRNHAAVGADIVRALAWLLPITATLMVFIAAARVEIVTLIYKRSAFDDRAALLAARALLGYAPGIIGLTLLEILHRVMVLRGRTAGYVVVLLAALAGNALASAMLVPRSGPLGLALGASVGALGAGCGMLLYAWARLDVLDTRRLLLVAARILVASAIAGAVLRVVRGSIAVPVTPVGQIALMTSTGMMALIVVGACLLAMGYRSEIMAAPAGEGAASP